MSGISYQQQVISQITVVWVRLKRIKALVTVMFYFLKGNFQLINMSDVY